MASCLKYERPDGWPLLLHSQSEKNIGWRQFLIFDRHTPEEKSSGVFH